MPLAAIGPSALYYEIDDFTDQWRESAAVYMQSGFCRNGNFWRGWVPHLARRYRVMRADLRGCGRSPDPGPSYEYRPDALAADVAALIEELELAPVHYIGESLGGIVGVLASVERPELFRSLTLISTPPRIRQDAAHLESLEFDSWAAALENLGLESWWLRVRREVFTSQARDDQRDTYFAKELARTSVRVGVELTKMVTGFNLEPYLQHIAVPTLLMLPLSSRLTSERDQADLASGIPGATVKAYPGASHDMYYLSPDTLAADVLSFYEALEDGNIADEPQQTRTGGQ